MRIVIALTLLVLASFAGACQTTTPPATTLPGDAAPPGPLDNVTNPMKQPRLDRTGALH